MKYDLCRAGILNVTPDKLSDLVITWANDINAEMNNFHAASLKSFWVLPVRKDGATPVHEGRIWLPEKQQAVTFQYWRDRQSKAQSSLPKMEGC